MAVADGNILVCTFPADSTDVGLGFPTGIVIVDQTSGAQTILNQDNFWSIPVYMAEAPGDFIYATNTAVGSGVIGQVYKIALQTGVATLISNAGLLDFPTQIIYLDGWLYVACVGQNADGTIRRIVRVDPVTGAQLLITDNFGTLDPPSVIVGLAPAPNNSIYVCDEPGNFAGVDLGSVWTVRIADGGQTKIASGGFFSHPSDMQVDAAGNILVMNTGGLNDSFLGRVFKINPTTGQQTLVGDVGTVEGLDSMSLGADGTIYLGSIKTSSHGGRVHKMDPVTGATVNISEGTKLSEVEGITVYIPAKFTTPPPTGNLPVTVNLAKAGNPFQSTNTPMNMMRCPICNLALTKHVTSGAAPNQMVTWNCVSGHSGIMHEQT